MKKKNKNSIYNNLAEKFSAEEIAESYVFPIETSSSEQHVQEEEFIKMRMNRLEEMTEMDLLQADLIRLRFQIERYISSGKYDKSKNFGFFLGEYIHSIRMTDTRFSKEISLHASTLSRLLNNKEEPNNKVLIRLEIHSNNIIPALYWYRLNEKQREFDLLNDKKTRNQEKKKVKQILLTNSHSK